MAQGCLAACPKQRCPPSTKFQGPNVACAYGLQLPIAQGRPAWLWPVAAAVWCSMHTTSRQPCHALIIARPQYVFIVESSLTMPYASWWQDAFQHQ